MRLMKQAYDVGLKGDDIRVLDGSWRDLFAEDDNPGIDILEGDAKHHESDEGEFADDAEPKIKREDSGEGSGSARGTRASKREKKPVKGQSTLDGHFLTKRQKTDQK